MNIWPANVAAWDPSDVKHWETTGSEVLWLCRITWEDSQWRSERWLWDLNVSLVRRKGHVLSYLRSVNGSRELRARWKAKERCEKRETTSQILRFKQICRGPGRWAASRQGASDTPFLCLLSRKRSHLLRGQTLGQEDSKQSSENRLTQ